MVTKPWHIVVIRLYIYFINIHDCFQILTLIISSKTSIFKAKMLSHISCFQHIYYFHSHFQLLFLYCYHRLSKTFILNVRKLSHLLTFCLSQKRRKKIHKSFGKGTFLLWKNTKTNNFFLAFFFFFKKGFVNWSLAPLTWWLLNKKHLLWFFIKHWYSISSKCIS